jgi:outer membrane immunogenic protein
MKIDELASIRARLGLEVTPSLLAYGTGGIALGHFQSGLQASFTFQPDPQTTANRTIVEPTGGSEFGWVAGAGLEYKLLDRWLLRAEYLHYDFGSAGNLYGVNALPPVDNLSVRNTVDVVRGGVSYKFGPTGESLKDAAPVSDWSGLYAGIDGGGGWARTDYPWGLKDSYYDPPNGVPTAPSQNSNGGLVGGHIGYNWQYERLVGGLEADFDFAGIQGTASVPWAAPSVIREEIKNDDLASVRARLGWTVRPDLLAYATGGLALSNVVSTINNHGVPSPSQQAQGNPIFDLRISDGIAQFGWVAGAGLEYKLLDHWLLRAEYLHYDFGVVFNNSYSEGTTPTIQSYNLRNTIDVVRGGVSYKF